MAVTKTKVRNRRTSRKPTSAVAMSGCPVLTLSEAAAYLRVSEDAVLKLVAEQALPGRQIGSEWRFLQSALDVWLCAPANRRAGDVLLEMAGSWKDDPYVDELLAHIYKMRGRAMIGE